MNIEVCDQKAEIAVAVERKGISMDDISTVTTEGLGKVFEFLAGQGIQMAGAPYLAYKNGNADFTNFDVEMGIPVAEEASVQGEYFMSKTYEGKAVCGTHKGAYKEIEPLYMAMMQYLADNSLESTGVYYDFYINDPANTPESELLTKVVFPVK